MRKAKMKKLFIDLEMCYKCKECTAQCSYYYHPENKGHVRCLALAAQEIVCRRCEEPPCVKSCPQDALEKNAEGMLQRYSMRCTSCKSCTIACPFGVIYPEIVEYKTSSSDCTSCEAENKTPLCVTSCPKGAIQYIEVKEDPAKDIYAVRNGRFFVHTVRWKRK